MRASSVDPGEERWYRRGACADEGERLWRMRAALVQASSKGAGEKHSNRQDMLVRHCGSRPGALV